MKFNFKKISAITTGVLMVGMTAGFAAGINDASFPSPFVVGSEANFAMVYGSGAGSLDNVPAKTFGEYLKGIYEQNQNKSSEFETGEGVTEDEVVLGDKITFSGSKIKSLLDDSKIPGLFDGKITWDDGESSNTEFNTHEEIRVADGLKIITSLDDEDLEEYSLTNDKGIEYRYVFDDAINLSLLGDEDADDFVISFLGSEVTITSMDSDGVTFTSGDEFFLDKGKSITFEGKTVTLESVFDEKVFISVNEVSKSAKVGETVKINGLEVRLSDVLYQNYAGGIERAEVFVSTDVEFSVEDGDAYVGEDDETPKWVWSINNPGEKDGYLGIRYDARELDSDDDVVVIGEEYSLPKNFAKVKFDGVTTVGYEDFKVYFDDGIDLYNSNDSGIKRENVPVLVLKGENKDAFVIGTGATEKETDSIYIYHNVGSNKTEVYYKDVNKDVSSGAKVRFNYEFDSVTDVNGTLEPIFEKTIGKLMSGDTELEIVLSRNRTDNFRISVGTTQILIGSEDASLRYLGSTQEDAEQYDVIAEGKGVGIREEDVIDHYGNVIKSPRSNADSDEVIIAVPSEQVKATISVLGSSETISEVPSELQLNSLIVLDNEVSSVSNKNIVVIGGSCINSEAARLLGVPLGTCGESFTTATGVGSGKYLIQTFAGTNGNIVVLVAGYEAQDTINGVNRLMSGDVSLIAGQRIIG